MINFETDPSAQMPAEETRGLMTRIGDTLHENRMVTGLVAGALALGVAGFGSREAQGNPDVTEEDFPGITEYREECSVLDHTTVQHVVAKYKPGSRKLLRFTAGVITHNNECDTDGGNPETDPRGNMDVGDREYYIYRQSWSKYARKWKTSSKVVHLSEDRVSNIHQIYDTIKTPRCETGTKYRGVVKVDWVSDNGQHDNTKSYPSKSKKC